MFLAAHRASELELVGSYLVSVGYLKEAVDLVDHHSVRLRQLVRAAHERGYPMSERWDERMTLFFSRSKASLFERVIEPLRVQVGFHLKQSVFEDWLDSAEGEVRLSQTNGLTKEGRFYPGVASCSSRGRFSCRPEYDRNQRRTACTYRSSHMWRCTGSCLRPGTAQVTLNEKKSTS